MSTPALVTQLQSAFLANVQAHLAETPYLSTASRAEISGLIGEGSSSRTVADALSHALVEDWAVRAGAQQSGEKIVSRRFGTERLFEIPSPMPSFLFPFDREGFLGEARGLPAFSRRVLEIDYSFSYFGAEGGFIEYACEAYQQAMGDFGLFFFERTPDSRLTLRVPTLSLLELGLRFCFQGDALKLCEAPDPVEPDQVNELHRLGYHPYALPLEPLDIHILRSQHPGKFGPHDGYHAAMAVLTLKAKTREAAAILYDILKESLPDEQWGQLGEIRDRLLDLNVDYARFRTIFRSLPDVVGMERALDIAASFSRALRTRFPRVSDRSDEIQGLLRFTADFRRLPTRAPHLP